MGLISWLTGKAKSPRKYAHIDGPGEYALDIVGESHYQKALEMITGGKT